METLHAVHVIAPDDVIAQPSREQAQIEVAKINTLNLEFVKAEVIEWPYLAKEHAEALEEIKRDQMEIVE